MSLVSDSPAVLDAFDRVCALVAGQRRGFTLRDLSNAHAIARELHADTSDTGRLAELAESLDLDLLDLRQATTPDPERSSDQ